MKTRVLALILAASIMGMAATGCSGNPTTSDVSGEAASTVSGSGDDGFDYDIGDVTSDDENGNDPDNPDNPDNPDDPSNPDNPSGLTKITIGSFWAHEYNSSSGASEYVDAYKAKIKEIRSKYKVNLQIVSLNTGSVDTVVQSIMAGDVPYDIMDMNLLYTRNMAMAGALLDQKTVSTIDLNASQFSANKAYIDGVTFKGKVYGSMFDAPSKNLLLMMVNQTLVNKYAPGNDIVKLAENKEWTMDKMREIANKITRDNIWGIVEGSGNGAFLTAFTGGTVTRDANEKYTPTMLNSNGVACYNFLKDLIHSDKVYKANEDGKELFKAGKVAFMPHYLFNLNELASGTEDEIVVVPMPIAKPYQNDYILGTYDTRFYSIPKSCKNPELVGKVYQELSTMNLTKIQKDSLMDAGQSSADADRIASYVKYLRTEYVLGVDVAAFNDKLNNSYRTAAGNPETTFNSVKTQFQNAVNDFYSKVK